MNLSKKEILFLGVVVLAMLGYFLLATPAMMDDGFHYERFAESLAQGKLDFKSFYGFQGLSFFAVPIFWLTGSHNSIIIASIVFFLLSIPLAYFVGRDYYKKAGLPAQATKAGIYFLILFLLMPYPYTTMMRGFQEAALLFFTLLIIYGSISRKMWTPVAWSVGGIVKPFALVLLPLFLKEINRKKNMIFLAIGLSLGLLYLGASYYQTGHLINNAAINSYQGNFDVGNPPPLQESFSIGFKGFLRIGANLLLHFRKIMVSPFVIVLGAISLLLNKNLKLRKEIVLAIVLNILLVGGLTFSFPKYLLPVTTLLSLVSVSYLLKYRWLVVLVLVDSIFIFLPIWDYFGRAFWDNVWVYLIPLWLALVIWFWSAKTDNS